MKDVLAPTSFPGLHVIQWKLRLLQRSFEGGSVQAHALLLRLPLIEGECCWNLAFMHV